MFLSEFFRCSKCTRNEPVHIQSAKMTNFQCLSTYLKKENFNRLALWHLIVLYLYLKFKEEETISQVVLSKVEIYRKNSILGPIFSGLCLIGHKYLCMLIVDNLLS